MTENFFLGAMSGDAVFGEHEEIRSDAISLLHIVGDEKRGTAKGGERVDQLTLDLAAKMRVEGGKRLVEQKGLWFDRESSRGERCSKPARCACAICRLTRASRSAEGTLLRPKEIFSATVKCGKSA